MILHTNVAAVKRKKGRGARSNKKAKREDVIQSVPLAITKSKVVTGDAKTPKANRGTKKPPNMHPVREWDGLVPLEKLLSTLTQSSSPIFFFFGMSPTMILFLCRFLFFFESQNELLQGCSVHTRALPCFNWRVRRFLRTGHLRDDPELSPTTPR